MREIKFRAWLTNERRMVRWFPEFFSDMSPVTGYGSEVDSDVVLMQLTDYRDRDNEEILECDIVWKDICSKDDIVYGYYGDEYEVEFINGSWMMRNLDTGELFLLDEYHSVVKVIGNRYENSDLLNN